MKVGEDRSRSGLHQMERYQLASKFIMQYLRKKNNIFCLSVSSLIEVRAQQAEDAGKGYTWLPEFDQLTLGLREHHDESYNDRVLPCTAAFALHLGRTFKPRTTYGAEAFTTILAFVQKELRGVKVQNDTFTRLLAFNSFAIFQVNEAGLPNAPHTGV